MRGFIRDVLKDRLLIRKVRGRLNPAVQLSQRQLFHYYADRARSGTPPPITDTGFSVFSQFEEDGKLLFVFSTIGMGQKRFVEIGSDDGINSNCANLYFNFGWHGLFVDANPASVKRGSRLYARYPHPWHYRPKFACARVTRENVDDVILSSGLQGEIDLLSIDIDGNDYWVWDAITVVEPRVVIIESNVEFGIRNLVVPYDPAYSFPGRHPLYHGASPVAMKRLARRKGYRLVGSNDLGFNMIFLKDGVGEDLIPEVPVESILKHPSAARRSEAFEEIKDWEFLEG